MGTTTRAKKSKTDKPQADATVIGLGTPQSGTTSRAMASMSVSFGLVHFPIKLYAATDDHSISFKQVTADGTRVRQRRIKGDSDEVVAFEDIEKGYELPDGSMIILTKDDMAALASLIDSSKTIDVKQFVDVSTIDPLALADAKTYYMAPDKIAHSAYDLLRRAMDNTGKAAVATVTLRNRESVCVLRTRDDLLILSMLNWADEIRVPSFDVQPAKPPSDVEIEMAEKLISVLSVDNFDISQYVDHYTIKLAEMVTAKMKGGTIAAPADAPAVTSEPSMADALRASLESLKAS